MTFTARQVLTAAQLNDLDIDTLTTSGDVTVGGTLTATISAAGSDGQIQYNNGGSFGGASGLYYQDSTGNVGIGTTSPTKVLHVYSATVDQVARFESGDSRGGIDFADSGTTNSPKIGAVGNDFWVRTGSVDVVSVTEAGNVGIGDTTPSYKLDVNGTGRFTGDVITDDLTVNGTISGNGSGLTSLNASNISSGTFPDLFNSGTRYNIGFIDGASGSNYDKLRVWSTASYTIGMVSAITHGALNDYAMTFRMNNDNDRGFWWGDEAHGKNQGAMSLSTDGRLYVSTSVKCGFGQTNTGNTFAYGLEVGGLTRVTQDGSSVYWYNQAISTAGNGQRAGIGMRNDGSNNSTVQLRPSGGYLYVRTWDDGTGVIMRADSYQNYSTMRDKQDVTDWGASKSVGAAVDPAYAIDATEMVRNLRPVKFRRTKHHRLSADIQNHNERRGRALDRLNTIRRSKGLEDYHTDETVHQCGRDCEGSPESPCKLYRDWEKGEVGFIAEEVVNVVPDAVSTDDNEQPLTIDPMTLIATCVKALQEIDTRLTSLEAL
jgi:hypothetical protein